MESSYRFGVFYPPDSHCLTDVDEAATPSCALLLAITFYRKVYYLPIGICFHRFALARYFISLSSVYVENQ
jgi:hypothetical protein